MKKAIVTLSIIAGIMAAATTVSAATITFEDAQKKALEAANLKEDQVIFKQAETDTDDGRQIYEVGFIVPGEVKYEFDIDMNTGAICEQDIDLWEADDDMEYADLIKAAGNAVAAAAPKEAIEGEITFTKCRRDLDDGVWQYEIELKLADGTEYDYELKAADGTIMDKDVDND